MLLDFFLKLKQQIFFTLLLVDIIYSIIIYLIHNNNIILKIENYGLRHDSLAVIT